MIQLPDSHLDFDEETHIYSLRGIKLPSVTQIMKPMSLMLYDGVPQFTKYTAANRGSRAHEQVSNYVLYGILESDEDTEPYVNAFRKFQEDYNPVWIGSEYRTYHQYLRYAGTIDLIGYIEPDNGTGVDVIDLKCTASFHRVMIATQTGAYGEALESHGIKVRKRYGLQLMKNGKYRFERTEDGYKTFLHSLAIYNALAPEMK